MLASVCHANCDDDGGGESGGGSESGALLPKAKASSSVCSAQCSSHTLSTLDYHYQHSLFCLRLAHSNTLASSRDKKTEERGKEGKEGKKENPLDFISISISSISLDPRERKVWPPLLLPLQCHYPFFFSRVLATNN